MIELKSQQKTVKDPDILRVGAFQFNVNSRQIMDNLEKIEELFSLKEIEEFDLVVLPELFSSGFYFSNLDEVLELNEILDNKLNSYARMYKLCISGSMVESENGRIYNSQRFWSKDGRSKNRYRKLHMFFGMGEKENFHPGDRLTLWHDEKLTWGGAICYDLRFPEMFAGMSRKGVHGFLIPAQWPKKRLAHWIALLQARAIEAQAVIVACNSISPDMGGNSLIVDWNGKILAQAEEGQALIKADFSIKDQAAWRKEFPVLTDRLGPKVYGYN